MAERFLMELFLLDERWDAEITHKDIPGTIMVTTTFDGHKGPQVRVSLDQNPAYMVATMTAAMLDPARVRSRRMLEESEADHDSKEGDADNDLEELEPDNDEDTLFPPSEIY